MCYPTNNKLNSYLLEILEPLRRAQAGLRAGRDPNLCPLACRGEYGLDLKPWNKVREAVVRLALLGRLEPDCSRFRQALTVPVMTARKTFRCVSGCVCLEGLGPS